MFSKKEIVFGTVMTCGMNNTLTVELENGELGIVKAEEVSRREMKAPYDLNWMVGRRLGFYAGSLDQNGYRILSGKAYEEDLYQDIVSKFRSGERNVYKAHMSSVTKDGKLAFYKLAQGVNASIAVHDFAQIRVADFNQLVMPRDLTVAVKEIDEQGRIRVCAKPAFGDFNYGIKKLSVAVGVELEGVVNGRIPVSNNSIVMLTPNLTVMAGPAAVGDFVKVRITHVNLEEQRLKGEIIENYGMPNRPVDFDAWCIPEDHYPAYLDVEAFAKGVGPKSRPVNEQPPAAAPQIAAEISYETNATHSPFSIRKDETTVRAPLNGGNVNRILFETQNSLLNEEHMMVAEAVNELRYTTSWQVLRYIHQKHGIAMTERHLRTIIDRLKHNDIIQMLNFSKDGQMSVQQILYPGATMYRAYTGKPRYLATWMYNTNIDADLVKCYLSSNQLLIGMLKSRDDIAQIVNRAYISDEATGLRIRPRHKLCLKDGSVLYIESARSNWNDGMLEKLQRYDRFFKTGTETGAVVVTLEDESMIEPFAKLCEELHLSYKVYITCDLKALPAPVLREVDAHTEKPESGNAGFFRRLIRIFDDSRSA